MAKIKRAHGYKKKKDMHARRVLLTYFGPNVNLPNVAFQATERCADKRGKPHYKQAHISCNINPNTTDNLQMLTLVRPDGTPAGNIPIVMTSEVAALSKVDKFRWLKGYVAENARNFCTDTFGLIPKNAKKNPPLPAPGSNLNVGDAADDSDAAA